MDESKISLMPQDAHHVPPPDCIQAALAYLQAEGFAEDDLALINDGKMRFYDAGPMGMSVFCPHCKAELTMEWWLGQMSHDEAANGYQLATISLPCCGAQASLDQLEYDVPQGFARFAIEIYDDEGINIIPEQERRLNEILGCPIRVVYWVM